MSTKATDSTAVPVVAAQPAVTSTAVAAAAAYPPPPVLPRLGRLPTNHTCQFCQHTGPTRIKEKFGTCAIIALVVLLLCFWPLFFLPLIMPSCKDKEHICQNCQRMVGKNEAGCDTCCKSELQ